MPDAGAVAEERKLFRRFVPVRPSRFLLEPLPAAPALPPSMAVVKPGRSADRTISHITPVPIADDCIDRFLLQAKSALPISL